MPHLIIARVYRRFLGPAIALIIVLAAGTIGYLLIGGPGTGLVDALYMTFITIATIGFSEIIDMTGKPGARIFTMVIAFAGIGVTTYIFSTLTAFIVAGELNQALRRRKMLKRISQLSGHYIVCGAGRVGANVAHELDKPSDPMWCWISIRRRSPRLPRGIRMSFMSRATAPTMNCSSRPASGARQACSP